MPVIHRLTRLTVDHLTDPTSLASSRPRFAWRIDSQGTALVQRAYELEVASAGASVWSSGVVESRSASGIEFVGEPLGSRTTYDWRVRTWLAGTTDPSDWATGTFTTSLLAPADWVASWAIPAQQPTAYESYSLEGALSGTEAPDSPIDARLRPPLHLRQPFTAEQPIVSARLYASARGVYECELNGVIVGDEVLAPGFDSYPHRISFQSYDVTALVTAGDNVLGLTVADGWWAGRIGLTGSSANYGDRVSAIWQLELTLADGSVQTVVPDAGTRSAEGPRDYADIFVGEHYDARRELNGWSSTGFDDALWTPVELEVAGRELLVPFEGEPVRRVMEFAPSAVLQTPAGDLVVDLGQVIAGVVRVGIRAEAGTVVTLEHSEVLDADGNFFSNIMGPNKDQTDVYVAAGRAGEVFEPTFTFHGFRYVRITGLPDISLDDVTAVVIGSDLRATSAFETSDSRINRLHENVIWSQRANFLSIPTDCPQRERAGWTGDLQVFMPAASTNMDVQPFVERWLANLRVDQLADGRVLMIIPVIPSIGVDTDGGQSEGSMGIGDISAAWSDAVVMVPWTLFERYGDVRPLRDNYAAMTAWVQFQMNQAETELPPRFAVGISAEQEARQRILWNTGFHFGDWLAPSTLMSEPMPGAAMVAPKLTSEVVAAMFHAHSLDLLARVADALGETADAARYRDRFERVRDAFVAEYVDDDGRMAAGLQGPYVVALAFGLVRGELAKKALAHLVDLVHANGDHLDTGFVSVPYLLDVLWDGGERDLARRLLHQDTVPSWLYEVDNGATTIWEAWAAVAPDGTVSPMSMNHYAFGCVDDWLFRRVAGLASVEPGYRSSRIEPDLDSSFDFATASHETPDGTLSVAWRRNGDEVTLTIEVPHNTTSELVAGGKVIALESGSHKVTVRHARVAQVDARSTTE